MNSPTKWKWNCRNCGRANATVPDELGKAACEHCASVQSLRPGPAKVSKSQSQADRPEYSRERHLPRSHSSDSVSS
jgi:hypothetical protein